MIGMKGRAFIPLQEQPDVIEARARSFAAMKELEAARIEEKDVLDVIWPPSNSTALVTIEREDWALARLAKRRPDAIHRAGHSTHRTIKAERAVASALAAQTQIETAVKAELRATACEKARVVLPELEQAIGKGVELTRKLEAVGRDAGLSEDVLTIAPFSRICGVSFAENALVELRGKILNA